MDLDARLREFLTRRGGQAFCDDCLRRNLSVKNRHPVQQATRAILREGPAYRRDTTFCAGCGNERPTTRVFGIGL